MAEPENEEFTDISGKPIKLSCQRYSPFCREFTVSSAKLSLLRVMGFTCTVWLLAYAAFYLTQNTAVLSSAIFVTLSGMLLHIHFVKVDHETLLVVGSLGVQLSSAYASGRESTTFIEMSRIKDIVINEAIHMSSKPRLNCLVRVYRSCQEVMGRTQ
ncbi:phosphatidylinositol N-acetylglucosaminyltransferase subunit H isoform X2 [Neoarius graeffei]|uniref:phosphatidylinositol N-acetylglucosaminyltransferase subunit H isoform X2 n=1 Tax=Neoarius graeffei TaxID=443677 RepID=UPI00298C9B5C|nr:phosphatidylinositol N-acetylglucosaminyltransferase subunit H isoform X2 [Neoarius graeffei]